jgi:GT2 family glycosyltransferase
MQKSEINTDIAVVIVNWNKGQHIIELLGELKSILKWVVDIYMVDNASTYDSVDYSRQKFYAVKVMVNKENLAGTGGFNAGIHHVCKVEQYFYVWFKFF